MSTHAVALSYKWDFVSRFDIRKILHVDIHKVVQRINILPDEIIAQNFMRAQLDMRKQETFTATYQSSPQARDFAQHFTSLLEKRSSQSIIFLLNF